MTPPAISSPPSGPSSPVLSSPGLRESARLSSLCFDPHDPAYLDETKVRSELTRVFQVCHECRRCESHCGTFPSLFELIERREDHDAGRLTPADQDTVVGGCVHCNLCVATCPYTPDVHELSIDVPRLMRRATAMQSDVGITSWRSRTVASAFGRADRIGRIASGLRGVANRTVGAEPGTRLRRLFARMSGVSSRRTLRPFADERFSTWFDNRLRVRHGAPQGAVTVFPTCLVEYRNSSIGSDLVQVYERNGVECSRSSATCCGAPSLHAGELGRFAKIARRNVRKLSAEVRAGTDIVVSQPGCGAILREAYVEHVPPGLRADAELVAARTFDSSEYLMRLHRADDTILDTDFTGPTVDRITAVGSGHLTAWHAEFDSRDLLRLTGARVQQIRGSAGVETPWGLRVDNEATVDRLGGRLAERVAGTQPDVVAADGDLSNAVLDEHLDFVGLHPMQVIARAYGIAEPGHR